MDLTALDHMIVSSHRPHADHPLSIEAERPPFSGAAAVCRVRLQSARGSLPPSLFQNRACRFPGTRLLSDTPLVMGTLVGL